MSQASLSVSSKKASPLTLAWRQIFRLVPIDSGVVQLLLREEIQMINLTLGLGEGDWGVILCGLHLQLLGFFFSFYAMIKC